MDRIYWPNVVILIVAIVFLMSNVRAMFRRRSIKKQKAISAVETKPTQAPLAPVNHINQKSEDKIMKNQTNVKAIAIAFLIIVCACTSPIWWGIIGDIGNSMSNLASSVLGFAFAVFVRLIVTVGIVVTVWALWKAGFFGLVWSLISGTKKE